MIKLFRSSYNTEVLSGLRTEFINVTDLPKELFTDLTINSKYSNFDTEEPKKEPKLLYFGIGINGYYNVEDTEENPPVSQPYVPKPTNLDIYQPIPIRCVPINEDLDEKERKMYRMRTIKEVDGKQYVCYWFKLVQFLDQKVKVVVIDAKTGEEHDYKWDRKNLWPKPDKNYTGNITGDSGDIVVVYLSGTCIVTGKEIMEVINVLYKGDMRYAKISEWGFYTGEDKDVTVEMPNGKLGLDYTEAIYSQLLAHRTTLGSDLSSPEAVHHELVIMESKNVLIL